MNVRESVLAAAISKCSGWEGAQDLPWRQYGAAGFSWRPSGLEFCDRCTNPYSTYMLREGFTLPAEGFVPLVFQSFRLGTTETHVEGRRQPAAREVRVWLARCSGCSVIYWIYSTGTGSSFNPHVETDSGRD